MAETAPPNLAKDTEQRPMRGLRTFASDQAALKAVKELERDAMPPAPPATPVETVVNEPLPQAAPIKAHKQVKRLDEKGERIPAFHELAKGQMDEESKTAIAIDDSEGAFGGTIITDTKRSGFRFFPALQESISGWFKNVTAPKKKEANTYAVPDAELRKGVIQKATSKTATIFTADSDTLRERIRERDNKFKETVPEKVGSDIIWTANTEPGYPLLEEGEDDASKPAVLPVAKPSNVSVTFTKRTQPESAATIPEPPAIVPPPPVAPPQELNEAPEIDRWAAAASASEPPTRTPITVKTAPLPKPPLPKVLTKKRRGARKHHWLEFDTNILSLVIFIAIIGFIVVFFFSRGVITSLIPQKVLSDFSNTTNNDLLKSAPDRDMLLTNLTPLAIEEVLQHSQKSFGSSLQEINLLLGSDQPLSSARFLALIEANVEPSFAQNIVEIRLAASNQPARAILFAISDPVAARGGVLAWEDTMLSSVNTVFQSSIASTSIVSSFVDEQIDATDVRVLYTADGTPKVVYGFIRENVIAITPDHTQFRLVLDHK